MYQLMNKAGVTAICCNKIIMFNVIRLRYLAISFAMNKLYSSDDLRFCFICLRRLIIIKN